MVIRERVEKFDAGTVGISFTYYPTSDKNLTLKRKEIVEHKDLKKSE